VDPSEMRDPYGNTIDREPFTFTYTTRDLEPLVDFRVPGEVGMYDARRDATELYVTYRNVSAVNLALYQPPVDDFISQLVDTDYRTAENYEPPVGTLVRDWTIDASELPLNARRFDLLNAGGERNNSCEGALPTRLAPGDIGVVTTEPDPLRARNQPPGGEIVELMYRDYQFTVVNGPRCIEAIPWYQVELRDGSFAWIAESVDDEYLVDVRVAANAGTLTVDADGGPLAPGIYFLMGDAPERRSDQPNKHFMVVATANVTLKYGQASAMAWVTDVHTGVPLVGVPVEFIGNAGAEVETVITDANGVAMTDRVPNARVFQERQLVALVDTAEHFGVGYDGWSNGVSPWQFGVNFDELPEIYAGYLYTDRPVYRPDQPVYLRGMIRKKSDVDYTVENMTANVVIYDPNEEIIFERFVELDEYGAFSEVFNVAPDAALGRYRLSITDPENFDRSLYLITFDVAEYRLPEYEVNVETSAAAVTSGDLLTANVIADYYFGGDVDDADVQYVVQARDYRFRYQGERGFSFIERTPYRYSGFSSYGSRIADGETITEANGEVSIEVPTDFNESQELTIEATVRDESGVSVSGRTTAIVHRADLYVGVATDRYINTAGNEINASDCLPR
ncbi:MAG: MG2 domain-containing protein, partial [Chloroflexota bacterium]